ncbi:unnamed protein product [Rhizophagus irregularis]|nr:unnamed protein product [Rhizophagus irregularis]
MTGKTSLGQLLEDKLLKLDEVQDGSACVFRISLVCMQKHEIHELHHGGSVFWDAFKYITQSSQLCIVALASYGHYGAYATSGSRSDMDISPVNNLTYHPGLVVYTMNHITERYTKKERNSLSFSEVFSFLKSHDFNDLIKNARAFYSASDLSDEERKIVTSVPFRKGHVWQMEFYRAACFGTIGYIDFYISNEKKLALIDIHHNKMKVPKPEKRGKHDIYVLYGKILNPLS